MKGTYPYLVSIIIGFGILIYNYNSGYNMGFRDGQIAGLAERDTSWSLYYDKNHLPYEDGYILISQMPYEGYIEFAGRTVFEIEKRQILRIEVKNIADLTQPAPEE